MTRAGKERTRLYREKIKKNPEKYEEYKSRDRDRKRRARQAARNLSESDLQKKRAKCRERVRLHRLRKRQNLLRVKISQPVYKTPQALGKAVSKVKRALPCSPRKRKAVINTLADAVGLEGKAKRLSSNQLPESTIKAVQDFFLLDSVSRATPGRKEYVIIRSEEGTKKGKLQKKYLLYSLREAYALFSQQHPCSISFSKFCFLRPANVLLSSKMPRNVCLCKYHDNVNLLCDSIHKAFPAFPSNSSQLVDKLVCDSENEKCMTGKCAKCPKWFDKNTAPLEDEIEWDQWDTVQVQLPQKKQKSKIRQCLKVVKKMKKVHAEGTVEDALFVLQNKIPEFLEHVFIKRQQSRFFENRLSSLKPNEAVVQVDFAENYTCYHQDEVQSAHWNHQQVTVFPVVIWSKKANSNETICESHAIVSDDRRHDKRSITVFMGRVLNGIIKEANPAVARVDVFSDGPSSQFKNKFVASFLSGLKARTGLNVKWHYFATSHGKGAVDGIGGTVKRSVWTLVSTRKVSVVDNAEDFAKAAREHGNLSTKIIFISEKQINSEYSKSTFDTAPTVPGISKAHCLEPTASGMVLLRKFSSQKKPFCEQDVIIKACESDDVNDSRVDEEGISDVDDASDSDDDVIDSNDGATASDDNASNSYDGVSDSDDNASDSDDGARDSDDACDSNDEASDGDDNASSSDDSASDDESGDHYESGENCDGSCNTATPISSTIKKEHYYAVDYLDRFYYGRVLAINENAITFKFLHSTQDKGTVSFNWPRHDDIDTVYSVCVFYGPVTLKGLGPFTIEKHEKIKRLFTKLRKERKA